jgi:hypothetical protein
MLLTAGLVADDDEGRAVQLAPFRNPLAAGLNISPETVAGSIQIRQDLYSNVSCFG